MAAGDGSDYAVSDRGAYQVFNELKNNHAGASAPSNPTQGVLWYDSGNSVLKIYTGSIWDEVSGGYGAAPVGAILAWIGGYYDSGGTSYTQVLGSADTIAGANAYLNTYGYYVCDGTAPALSGTLIWNTAGRYLPNLTDDRFIMGDTTCGTTETGGENTKDHTHDFSFGSDISPAPSATVDLGISAPLYAVASGVHTHQFFSENTTSEAVNSGENRPLYLAVFFIARVK